MDFEDAGKPDYNIADEGVRRSSYGKVPEMRLMHFWINQG
jgi:hypothetical protein